MQLNIYVFVAALLTELLVLEPISIKKVANKLADVFANCHENFLLMVDFILQSTCGLAAVSSIDHVILRKIVTKKLKGRAKTNKLTTFRQNNEQSRTFLKRVTAELTEICICGTESLHLAKLVSAILNILRLSLDEVLIDSSKTPDANQNVIQ